MLACACHFKTKSKRIAKESLRIANEAVSKALKSVTKAEARVYEVNHQLTNGKIIYEDKKCSLKEPNKNLNDAREYHLQLIQTAVQVPDRIHSVYKLFQEMMALQKDQQRVQEEMKEALVSLSHKQSSKSYTDEEACSRYC